MRVDWRVVTLPELQTGDLVRVTGEVRGKDILEPLGRALQKAHLNVELAPELENLIVPRPTAYVLAREISLIDNKEEAFESAAKMAGRPFRIRGRRRRKPRVPALFEPGAIQVT